LPSGIAVTGFFTGSLAWHNYYEQTIRPRRTASRQEHAFVVPRKLKNAARIVLVGLATVGIASLILDVPAAVRFVGLAALFLAMVDVIAWLAARNGREPFRWPSVND
jgi:heme A synthase